MKMFRSSKKSTELGVHLYLVQVTDDSIDKWDQIRAKIRLDEFLNGEQRK